MRRGPEALELNLYHVAADPRRTADEVECSDLEVVAAVRSDLDIPLAVKLRPYYSAMANFASGSSRRGRAAWCCSTASTSPTSISTR